MANEPQWDIFISHANEDKETVAIPLAEELSKYPIKVWLDNKELKIGDSLMKKINEGIARSRFGVVILSPDYFAKEWTERELDMLFVKEKKNQIVILPVWHNVRLEDVESYNLLLASRLGIPASKGFGYVADEIAGRVWPDFDISSLKKTVRELKYIDRTVEFLIRASNISDIITLLIQDAPRNSREYRMARDYVWRLIIECQPYHARNNLLRDVSVKIKDIESVNPFDLLGHWASIGVLSYALGEYEVLYNAIIAVQDAACQFQKEGIWIAGAKYSFGLSVFFLMRNMETDKKSVNQKLNEYCQQLIMSKAEGSRISEDTRFLSIAFHELAYRLWECKFDANEVRQWQSIPDDLLSSVKELAVTIDSRTDYAPNLGMWLTTTFFDSFRTPDLSTGKPD